MDTLRADYVGVYGFEGDVTPNLDRLASEGVLFRRCFSQAPWTKPSVASLFTSLHVGVHGVVLHNRRFGEKAVPGAGKTETLSAAATTVAEALRGAGYATAAFVANPWLRAAHGFAQGFDLYDSRMSGQETTADSVVGQFWQWLRRVPREKPFFAYLHLMDVHGPYSAPEADYEAVRHSPSLGAAAPLDGNAHQRIPAYLKRSPWYSRRVDNVRVMRGRYAAGIRALDRRLAVFFDQLRQEDLWDRAVIVVTSDHGEQLYEHGGWDHGFTLFDEELHVPLIIKLPGGRHAGHRVNSVVSLIDLMPTLLAMAGAPPVQGVQGRSLLPLLSGAKRAGASYASAVKGNLGLHSVRTERYKLIHDLSGPPSNLFDLMRDPHERTSAAGELPEARVLRRLLEQQLEDNRRRRIFPPDLTEVPPEQEERLRALGYD